MDIVGILIGLIIGALLTYVIFRIKLYAELYRLRKELEKKQNAIIKGKVSEELFPLLYRNLGDLSNLRFLGSPIDYIQFAGLSEGKDVTIRFIEVKSGNSGLSYNERKIKEAVEKGRIEWKEINMDDINSHL